MKQVELVYIGDIVNTHGLNGELRILSDSDFKEERFRSGAKLQILDDQGTFVEHVEIQKYRVHKNFDLLTFKGKDHISHAERYKGMQLAVLKSSVGELAEDDGYYFSDIRQCDVYDIENILIGQVDKIVAMPSYDLWYIKREGKKELLVPYTEQFIKKVDIPNKRIDIDILEGLDI
ncbi:ribosome maturation factor RimM [Erysipelotrichaceae bacterium]|nr:ribosome maturation factor RimM [Erysipelotrichaceae bacterium]